MTPQEMVLEFHETYGQFINDEIGFPQTDEGADGALLDMRLDLIEEEYFELCDATAGLDLIEVVDALADMVYVIYGYAHTIGVDLDDVLAEVHRSNMSKLGADGKPMYREDGKVLKGPNFSEPNIALALQQQAFAEAQKRNLDQTLSLFDSIEEGKDLPGVKLMRESLERHGESL